MGQLASQLSHGAGREGVAESLEDRRDVERSAAISSRGGNQFGAAVDAAWRWMRASDEDQRAGDRDSRLNEEGRCRSTGPATL